jgi:hypothetical protein
MAVREDDEKHEATGEEDDRHLLAVDRRVVVHRAHERTERRVVVDLRARHVDHDDRERVVDDLLTLAHGVAPPRHDREHARDLVAHEALVAVLAGGMERQRGGRSESHVRLSV